MRGIVVGTISQIGDVQEFGENGFKKQELILKTVEEYPNIYCLEFTQKNIELVENLSVGENVKIYINVKGREYKNDKGELNVFHSINAWKVEKI